MKKKNGAAQHPAGELPNNAQLKCVTRAWNSLVFLATVHLSCISHTLLFNAATLANGEAKDVTCIRPRVAAERVENTHQL